MVGVLQGLDHVASIQDDILMTGRDDDHHIKNLGSVLSRLDSYGLILKLRNRDIHGFRYFC